MTFDTRAYTTLKCDIIRRNLPANIPGAFPQPERTWEKDEVTYYSATPWAYPVITPEFMTKNSLMMQGLTTPDVLEASVDGSLVFNSQFTLKNTSLVMFPPGTTSASAKRMIFESLLGTWTCSVNNSLGNDSCSSTIRECGRYLHVCVSFTVVLTVQDPTAAVKKNRLNFSLWHGVVICICVTYTNTPSPTSEM